jgi:hypothetical protein
MDMTNRMRCQTNLSFSCPSLHMIEIIRADPTNEDNPEISDTTMSTIC